jgi:hypothetical protein
VTLPPDATTCGECSDLGANCGQIVDNCGTVLDCGSCPAGESCGGGGPNICGVPCQPLTCADVNVSCGPIGDGCGNLIASCGSCSLPEKCGGDGATPGACSVPSSCVNLCLQQTSCPSGTTSLSGTVYAPGTGQSPGLPLFGALVYVPNAPVEPFPAKVSCTQCDAEVSGKPLVSTTSGTDGKFVLGNVPVGQNIPLVIQVGRWRRQVVIPSVSACQDHPLDWQLTRFPRNQSEGDIPRMAIVTGAVDELECVLRKIGIEDAEFTHPNASGRVNVFSGLGAAGQTLSGPLPTPTEDQLWSQLSTLEKYDLVLFPCQGAEYYMERTNSSWAPWPNLYNRLLAYTGAGGRIFTTHYSYVWLHGNANTGPGPWESAAVWKPSTFGPPTDVGVINTGFPKGQAFADWLIAVQASVVHGSMPVNVVRKNSENVKAAQLWMSASASIGGFPLHFTFNTPIEENPSNQCGRVVFSDFHISDKTLETNAGKIFPAGCNNNPMTPQEKLVAFMLFDLASCVGPDLPTCTPLSCADQGIACGPAGDGCGAAVQCGDCPPGQQCGGGGKPGVCGDQVCIPKSCEALGIECGLAGDGCGNLIDCGGCPLPNICGGSGQPGKCGGAR